MGEFFACTGMYLLIKTYMYNFIAQRCEIMKITVYNDVKLFETVLGIVIDKIRETNHNMSNEHLQWRAVGRESVILLVK